jgi:hypothetical protein
LSSPDGEIGLPFCRASDASTPRLVSRRAGLCHHRDAGWRIRPAPERGIQCRIPPELQTVL